MFCTVPLKLTGTNKKAKKKKKNKTEEKKNSRRKADTIRKHTIDPKTITFYCNLI